MSAYITRRARDTIVRLAGQGLDLPTFWRESSAALARVVPHDMTPCWFTFDPARCWYQPLSDRSWRCRASGWRTSTTTTMFTRWQTSPVPSRGSRRSTRRPEATSAAAPATTSTCVPLGWSRNSSSPCAPGQETPGACLVSIASKGSPCSMPMSCASCATSRCISRGRPPWTPRWRGY